MTIRLRTSLTSVFSFFLFFQIAFFAWVGWAWTARHGLSRTFAGGQVAKAALRLAGSNTIGAELAPALAEEFLRRMGAVDVQRQHGVNEEERIVSGTLPGHSAKTYITISSHGSATAFSSFANDACDIGMASRKIRDEEARNLSVLGDMTSLAAEHVLGLDGIAIIVNSSNPVQSLTISQIANIFTGTISDWSSVGGKAGAIKVFARDDKSGTFDTFKTTVLAGRPLSGNSRRFEDSNQLSQAVANDVNGIGFIGLPYIHSARAVSVSAEGATPLFPNPLTVATEDYALSRRLYLYTAPNSQNKLARDFIEFALSRAGQNIVANQGFISQNLEMNPQAATQNAPAEYRKLVQGASRLTVDFRFRSGRSELDNKAVVDLDRMATFISDLKYGGEKILLFGFSDSAGARPANLELSHQRATTVAEEFTRRGLKPSVVEGFGADLAIASNDTPDGREKNRRVEVWLRAGSSAN